MSAYLRSLQAEVTDTSRPQSRRAVRMTFCLLRDDPSATMPSNPFFDACEKGHGIPA